MSNENSNSIVFIPLDGRPCNIMFPVQLAKLSGVELKLPPTECLDKQEKDSDYPKLREWLFSSCDNNTTIVAAIDNYVFGSLLATRAMRVTKEECMLRINDFKLLKEKYPSIKIYGFDVLMRTSISTPNAESIKYWTLVNEYSQAYHKAQIFKKSEDISRVAELKKLIPTEILQIYLDARERNHAINCACIEFVKEGVFTDISITQEDSTPYGMHKTEQAVLEKMIIDYNLCDRVRIHNGTDEGCSVALGRAIVDSQKLDFQISYCYLNDNRTSFIASYEDRLFHDNLLSQINAIGATALDCDKDCENVLYIYTPVDKQYEASFGDGNPPCDYTEKQLEEFAERIANSITEGKKVYFLDVAYANGGQGDILRKIANKVPLESLYGYSAWNTASNALGTILAQIVLGSNADKNKNLLFTMERVLDDFAYQGVVRKRLREALIANNEDPMCIINLDKANKLLAQFMEEFILDEPMLKSCRGKGSYRLPWTRIFEAEITIAN